ncbi:hypothetical protein NPX13_g3968 [Xylaria arbuscula]|uniref:Receptor L-domain domain-containing protein n=1 Tax=Xylaria arbuscula TaxID=114810 RepID=A0A9W8NGX0_9PEZI|nr:hypothetical protein NPX13_g3968 [Xylaria arbuscula]
MAVIDAGCQNWVGPVNITSQADIDDNTFAQYDCYDIIYVRDAIGSLNFTNLESVGYLNVSDSPELESLIFPKLLYLYIFRVHNAKFLLTISMPYLTVGTDKFETAPIFDIIGGSALQNLDYGNVSEFWSFRWIDSAVLAITNVTYIVFLVTDSNASFPNLTAIDNFTFKFTQGAQFGLSIFPELTEIGEYTLEDGPKRWGYDETPVTPNTLNGSLSIRLLNYTRNYPDGLTLSGFHNSLDFSTTTIGQNASIYSNNNVHIGLDNLVTIGANFSFINNTNCSLNLNQLSKVGDLVIVDNTNTTLPILPNLETVNNIHFRGLIDTTDGINLFPSLSLVSGSVIIEAWNSDFNCSKLVAQHRDSIIHNLSCNGTDNSTTPNIPTTASPTASTSPSSSPHGMSDGAWAGVGVGIAAIVLGSIIALAWLFLHYRRQQKASKEDPPSSKPQNEEEVKSPDVSGLREAEDGRIIREAPEGAVHEMPVPPAEKPDDHLREMAAAPGELPTSSPVTRFGEGEDMNFEEEQRASRGHDDYSNDVNVEVDDDDDDDGDECLNIPKQAPPVYRYRALA